MLIAEGAWPARNDWTSWMAGSASTATAGPRSFTEGAASFAHP